MANLTNRDFLIKSITGFRKRSFPIIYLECPLYIERRLGRLFSPVLQSMQQKLEGWTGKLLSTGAKITLIKHVLQDIPIHYLSLIQPPASTIQDFHSRIYYFPE